MSWFETLTGCPESSPALVREALYIDGPELHSRRNGHSWRCGWLELSTLAQLRAAVALQERRPQPSPNRVRDLVAEFSAGAGGCN